MVCGKILRALTVKMKGGQAKPIFASKHKVLEAEENTQNAILVFAFQTPKPMQTFHVLRMNFHGQFFFWSISPPI